MGPYAGASRAGAVVFIALGSWGGAALAQEAPAQRSQLSLTVERFAGLGFTYGRVDEAHGGVDFSGFVLGGPQPNPLGASRLGVDFITAGNVVLGGSVGVGTQTLTVRAESSSSEPPSGNLWTLLLGVRGGYRVKVSDRFEVVPRLGLTVLTGTMTLPGGRSCSYRYDSLGNPLGTTCSNVEGPSGSLTAGTLSLDVVGRVRLTPGFFVDAGLAYDHVIFASFSTAEPRVSGTRTTEPSTSGTYLNAQLWFGLGGYL